MSDSDFWEFSLQAWALGHATSLLIWGGQKKLMCSFLLSQTSTGH